MLVYLLACHDDAPSKPDPTDSAPSAVDDFFYADLPVPASCPAGAWPEAPAGWTPAAKPNAGDARYFASSPERPERVWMGASIGGLYLSEDGGKSWEHVNIEGPVHAEADFVIDPEDPGAVFYSAGAIWHHDGVTGTQLSLGSSDYDLRVHGLVLDRDGSFWAVDARGVLFVSDDRGQSFVEVGTIGPAAPPGDSGSARELDENYWALLDTGDALLAARHSGELYRSVDGYDWEMVDPGPLYGTALAVSGQTVWMVSGDDVVRSDTGGLEFASVFTPPEPVVAIDVLPDGTPVFATERSVKVGETGDWVELADFGQTYVMGLGHTGDGVVLVGHHEGILRSEDGGRTFLASDLDLVVPDPAVVNLHPSCPGVLLTGTWCTRGLYRSRDGGVTLEHEGETFAHYVMTITTTSRPEEYWVTADESLLYSDDYGVTWEDRGPGAYHFHALAVHPDNPDLVLVGSVGSGESPDSTGRVYRTESGGEAWAFTSGLPETPGSAHSIVFWPDNPLIVLLATHRGGIFHTDEGDGVGLYRSEDVGKTWNKVESFPELNVRLLAACEGLGWALTETGLYRSLDEGQSWEQVALGDWEALACHRDAVVVGGREGVSRSQDGGETFDVWDEGLDGLEDGPGFAGLAFSYSGRLVYFGHADSGLWYRGWNVDE